MSYLQQVIDEAKSNKPTAEPVADNQTTEAPATTEEAPKPEETVEKVETPSEQPEEAPKQPEQVDNGSDKPEEAPKPKKDLSNVSKEEKAQYAFKRQLEKQKTKYEQQIKEIQDSFKSQFDELKKTVEEKTKPKEEVKTRHDFDTDDEYIQYLSDRRVDAKLAEMDAKKAKEAEEAAAKAKEDEAYKAYQQQITDTFEQNCAECFKDEAAYGEFAAKVNRADKNGLGGLLAKAPAIRDYIFTNKSGPLVLNEMLTKREAFVRVMSCASNPTDAIIEMHDLAREIKERANQPQEVPAQPKMPRLGKPGANHTEGRKSVTANDKDLINFIRSRR